MTDYYSAKHWAEKARKQATGNSTENPDGSAKYWAERAEAAAATTAIPQPSAADAGKFLMTNGLSSSWEAVGASYQSVVVSTSWSAVSGGGYKQDITLSGMRADIAARMELVQSADYATAQIEQVEYAKIYKAVTGAGSITLYADEPTTSTITINIIK